MSMTEPAGPILVVEGPIALAVGLDRAGAAEGLDEATRHLAPERLQRFHHRLDVLDVTPRVRILQQRRDVTAAQRPVEARTVVVPHVLDAEHELAHVDGGLVAAGR